LREYKKQLDALREDLKAVIQYCPNLRTQIIAISDQVEVPVLSKKR
jgi:hypothetical protein